MVHWGLTNWEGALTKKGGAWGLKKEEGGGALRTNKRGRCIGGLKKGGKMQMGSKKGGISSGVLG